LSEERIGGAICNVRFDEAGLWKREQREDLREPTPAAQGAAKTDMLAYRHLRHTPTLTVTDRSRWIVALPEFRRRNVFRRPRGEFQIVS